MKKKGTETTNFAELRERAEKLQTKSPAIGQPSTKGDLQELIQELQTHQVELELQNEELRQAQAELEGSRQKYFELFDFAPVGYFMIDRQGVIVEVNLTGARLLGLERRYLIGTGFTRYIDPAFQDQFYLHRQAVIETGSNQTCDLKMVRPDASQIFVRLESTAVEQAEGKQRQIRTAITNITDRVQTRQALRKSEEKYKLLFNEMISGFALHELIFDRQGKPIDTRILEINKTIERYTGFKAEQVVGKRVKEIWPATESSWFEKFGEVAATGTPMQFENYHRELDRHFMVSAFRPQRSQVAVTFTDITDRRRFEEALQEAHDELEKRVSERTAELAVSNESLKQEIAERNKAEEALEIERQRLFAVLDELPAYVYLEAPDHSVRFANRYFREHFGQFEGKKCYELLKGQEQRCKICPTSRVFETGEPQDWESSEMGGGRTYQIYDYPFRDIDGTRLTLELGIDITKRKRAELELRRLSSRLLNVQEDERRRIAFELHDQLGQDLSVLKLQIGSIKRNLQKDPGELEKMCQDILLEIDKTIEMVRRISRDLSPSILADLGLSSALRWLIRNFLKHSDIEISTAMEDIKDLFSDVQQIAIYRIIQEIFTNIRKHAEATQVYVNIKKNEERVRFSIEDNGIGFDIQQVTAQYSPEKGLGLAAMDERSKMIGGHFEISSQKGRGTKISFEVPIDSST